MQGLSWWPVWFALAQTWALEGRKQTRSRGSSQDPNPRGWRQGTFQACPHVETCWFPWQSPHRCQSWPWGVTWSSGGRGGGGGSEREPPTSASTWQD